MTEATSICAFERKNPLLLDGPLYSAFVNGKCISYTSLNGLVNCLGNDDNLHVDCTFGSAGFENGEEIQRRLRSDELIKLEKELLFYFRKKYNAAFVGEIPSYSRFNSN